MMKVTFSDPPIEVLFFKPRYGSQIEIIAESQGTLKCMYRTVPFCVESALCSCMFLILGGDLIEVPFSDPPSYIIPIFQSIISWKHLLTQNPMNNSILKPAAESMSCLEMFPYVQ